MIYVWYILYIFVLMWLLILYVNIDRFGVKRNIKNII